MNKNAEQPNQNIYTYKDLQGSTFLEQVLMYFNYQAKDGNIYNFDFMYKKECIEIIHYIQNSQIFAYLYIIFTLLLLSAFVRLRYTKKKTEFNNILAKSN